MGSTHQRHLLPVPPPPAPNQPPVGADPRHGSTALGPWGDPPLTLFSKGKDDFGTGKGKHFGKDKGTECGKHKTKDKRAFPYKGGPYDVNEEKGGHDFPLP